MSRKTYFTPIKRSQLITNAGVGSVVRTRNGITAIVRGLADWEAAIPIHQQAVGPDRDIERERFKKKMTLRDPELENACNVSRFIVPESLPDNPRPYENWFVPVMRFPLAGFCTNYKCNRIIWSSGDDVSNARCKICSAPKTRAVQQMPIFMVCSKGHIDEIDWVVATHENCTHSCNSTQIKVSIRNLLTKMSAQCLDCDCKSDPDTYGQVCSGRKAWLVDSKADTCPERMHVIERTSVQAYYPSIKTALYLPSPDDYSDVLIEWILVYGNISHIDVNSTIQINGMVEDLRRVNLEVPVEELIRHINYLQNKLVRDASNVWDPTEARTRELDVLLNPELNQQISGPKLLERSDVNLAGLNDELFGESGIFSRVVAVPKLAETRIQDGFSRYTPDSPNTVVGQKLMWGFENSTSPWLPGYRVYGEGILFVINAERCRTWLAKNVQIQLQRNLRYLLAHTMAHLFLSAAALECGYQLAGIRDRVYDLPDGRLGFLVYAAEGDSVGTLGGLVELSSRERIESLVNSALSAGHWCAQDPVCISETTYQIEHNPGACHQCVLLPETSCESFNQELDRAVVYGNTDRGIQGFMSRFNLHI